VNTLSQFWPGLEADDIDPLRLMLDLGHLTHIPYLKAGSSRLSLRLTNLEVKASLLALLSGDGVQGMPELMSPGFKVKCVEVLRTFFSRDAEGFAEAFACALSELPASWLRPLESCYQSLFYVVMALAGQEAVLEEHDWGGILDMSLAAFYGDLFVVEMKYLNAAVTPDSDGGAAKDDRPVKPGGSGMEAESLLKQAMRRISGRRYFHRFKGDGFRIWKTAVVISGKTDVAVAFEEARDWTLTRTYYGYEIVSPAMS
jgi:hypothetical protein